METTIYTTIVYWGNIGIMENRMETTIPDGCFFQEHQFMWGPVEAPCQLGGRYNGKFQQAIELQHEDVQALLCRCPVLLAAVGVSCRSGRGNSTII